MPDTSTPDAQLLAAARAGDLGAFESLVRAHTPAVYGHALRFFGETIGHNFVALAASADKRSREKRK